MKRVKTKVRSPFFSEEAVNSLFAIVIAIATIVLCIIVFIQSGKQIPSEQYVYYIGAIGCVLMTLIALIISLRPFFRFRKYKKVLKKQKVRSIVELAEKCKTTKEKVEFDIKNLSNTNQLLKESPIFSNYVVNKSTSDRIMFKFPEKKLAYLIIQPVLMANFFVTFMIIINADYYPVAALTTIIVVGVSFTYMIYLLVDLFMHISLKKKLVDKGVIEINKKSEKKAKELVKCGHVVGLSINKHSGALVYPHTVSVKIVD